VGLAPTPSSPLLPSCPSSQHLAATSSSSRRYCALLLVPLLLLLLPTMRSMSGAKQPSPSSMPPPPPLLQPLTAARHRPVCYSRVLVKVHTNLSTTYVGEQCRHREKY
jgi:hypothetical protein